MQIGDITQVAHALRDAHRALGSDAVSGIAIDSELDDPRIPIAAAHALLVARRVRRGIREADPGYADFLDHKRLWPSGLGREADALEVIRDTLAGDQGDHGRDDYLAAVAAIQPTVDEQAITRAQRPSDGRRVVALDRIDHAIASWPAVIREAYRREIMTSRVWGFMIRAVGNSESSAHAA